MVVEVRGVTKVFEPRMSLSSRGEGVTALSGVEFRVERGECVGILGGNGSGKSTLLKIVAGLLEPTRGTVRTQGRLASLIELGAGFDPEYTGRENLRLVGALLGLSAGEVARREEGIVAFAGLEHAIDRAVREYSAGMFMRLAFSLATHVDAEILLVDEVLAVGDAAFRARCRERLDAFRARGGTLLVAGHDLAPLGDWCERALWLHRGLLRADGSPRSVIGRYLGQLASERVDARGGADGGAGAGLFVRLADAGGRACAAFRAGDALRVRVELPAGQSFADPAVGVFVNRADWTCCFGADSAMDRFAPGAGARAVELEVDALPLVPGQYVVSASLRDGDRPVTMAMQAAQFEVLGEPAPGVFRPRVRWERGRS